jgi:hypothetical protein
MKLFGFYFYYNSTPAHLRMGYPNLTLNFIRLVLHSLRKEKIISFPV